MKLHAQFRTCLQALLISAVMLAPVWGQIHKTIHGLKSTAVSEQSLFSEHTEGSLVCQALDHLASDDGLQAAVASLEFAPPFVSVVASHSAYHDEALTLAFSARAPPKYL